jgi:hypothetical protein
MFHIIFGDFVNNPLSSGSNFVWQKMPLFSLFDFPRAMRLEKEQLLGLRFGNFETEK